MKSLTVFRNIYDNDTSVRVDFENFQKFERSLYQLSTMVGYKPKKGEFYNKKHSRLISPAIYEEGKTRANDNVISWAGWAAIDVDKHDFKSNLEKELQDLYGKWQYVCYSTASSTEDMPKFRLVFNLKEHVLKDKIKHFWFALNSEFGNLADRQTKDLSRMFYIPAKYPNAFNFIFSNSGEQMDPEDLMAKWKWVDNGNTGTFLDNLPPEMQKEIVNYRKAKMRTKPEITWNSYDDCPFVNQDLIKEYKSIAFIDGSGRYSLIYKIMVATACNAIKKGYPISEHEIIDLILRLDRDNSNLYAKRKLNTEAARAIAWAYKTM